MKKVLIIDDEPAVRRGIANIIEWGKYGYIICGMAEDGLSGLEKIKSLKPDLVLVDVKMPRMDGLELIQRLYKEKSEVRIIILSGYAQFEYAQKALAYGVDAYLLKPVDEVELITLVKKIYEQLVESNSSEELNKKRVALSTEKIIENIVIGHLNFEEIMKLNSQYSLSFPWDEYQVMVVGVNDEMIVNKDIKAQINSAINKFIARYGKGHTFSTNNHMGMLFSKDLLSVNDNLLIALRNEIKLKTNQSFTISIGKVVKEVEDIKSSYMQALDLLKNKFVFGSHKILTPDLIERNKYRNDEINIHETAKKLVGAMYDRDKNKISEILADTMQIMKSIHSGQDTIKSYYLYLYNMIVAEFQGKNAAVYEILKNDKEVLNDISSKRSLDELNDYMLKKLNDIISKIDIRKPVNVIDLLIAYIHENYEKDLKLNYLATKFNYGSTYLGKLIKNHTGYCFNNYLDRIRIDKSKELLKERYKVYEVSNIVGYCNINYFYSKFKSIVGMSPTQYRSSFSKDKKDYGDNLQQ